jgi:hypothetical protein
MHAETDEEETALLWSLEEDDSKLTERGYKLINCPNQIIYKEWTSAQGTNGNRKIENN